MDGMDEVSIPELHVREFRPVAAEWCGRTEGQCPLHVPMLYVLTLPSQSYHFIVLTASTVTSLAECLSIYVNREINYHY